MTAHQLTRRDARRIAVRAQLLHRARPATMPEVVRHLTMLQVDQTAAVAPSADLVLWSRLGSAYDPAELAAALADHTLIELRGRILPREDVALYRAEMAGWATRTGLRPWEEDVREWVDANDDCRRDILRRLETEGPLPVSELPDTCAVRWKSSGWNDDRNVTKLLDFMVQRGEVASAGRRGRERLWDLATRIYPDDMVPEEEALRLRNERRLRALGIARPRGPECPVEPSDVGAAGEPAVVEGVKGVWRVDPAYLDQDFSGRAALLSPLDRLVFDRKRMAEYFEFDYTLEMYKPAARRRWGYYALPILYGDRLVGKLDATADRRAGMLRVDAVHEDAPFGKTLAAAVRREIEDLAHWLHLDLDLPG
ncbi:DNA glycosylase AlkZ-like family protein [Nucisporomicrobium flavum]|uniref:DNA glycosylase AlkZ-like family protein n=1 Tax=Nucisporomicrobium flavum TaxID=2785915 RepID=UPI0018F73E50|nr:crosslink repair DNA glycosylase YcaQ family protein [Nucisporomicrobium flavum]